MKKRFKVTVKQIAPDEALDHDDREENPSGEHFVEEVSEDAALDEFHATVPIACLDDFDISIEEMMDGKEGKVRASR